jgi:hypothetical protein
LYRLARRTCLSALLALCATALAPAMAHAIVPINLTPPTISGTAQEGYDLTCSNGTWLNDPTAFFHQWNRNGVAIAGETTPVHRVVSQDVGSAITCTVSAANLSGTSLLPATSAPVFPIVSTADQPPVNLTPPVLSGTAQQGHDLSCSDGTWMFSPTSYARKWRRDGAAIGGATGTSYTVQAADVGHQLTCSVAASNAAGPSAEATSQPVVPVGPAGDQRPVNLTPPVIGGVAQQGQELTCSDGTWLFAPTSFAHQWNRDGTPISGATAAAYSVQAADVAHQLTCSAAASNGAGASAPATSLPIVPVPALAAEPEPEPENRGGGAPSPAGPAGPAETPQPAPGDQPAGADKVAPLVTGFGLTNRRFTVTGRTTALAAARAKRGTTFRFRLTEPATARLTIVQLRPGYRDGKRCARVTAGLRRRLGRRLPRGLTARVRARRVAALLRRRACELQVAAGALTRQGVPGLNAVAFSGRLGRRSLPPGRYVASIRAVDAAGNASIARSARFEVAAVAKPASRR